MSETKKEFFVSYTGVDEPWAEWIAWHLEEAGHSCTIQAWDFVAGRNFVQKVDDATKSPARTIAVLSPDYVKSGHTFAEWAAAFAADPASVKRNLIPVRVRKVEGLTGLLAQIIYIDIVDLSESDARERLLKSIKERYKPDTPPTFPGTPKSTPSTPAPAFPPTLPPRTFLVPNARNGNFTGRDDILTQIRTNLTSGVTTALTQAIRGLGGIGKTQTAIEYAYRHEHYYTHVLWINADTRESATASMGEIARALGLPESQDRAKTAATVKRWLADNTGYLLILDNADDIKLIPELLPTRRPSDSHVIITTRAVALAGVARPIEIPKLTPDDGAAFLLRRANVDATDDNLTAAREISAEMDGLPLALDQAGAYIEETGISPRAYLDLYRNNRGRLLARAGEISATNHPTVAVTFFLALEKVESLNPAAAELVRFCAFLAPEPIPLSILTKGSKYLGDVLSAAMADDLTRTDTIAAAHRWSLLDRDGDTISLHRVVQEVVRESVPQEERRTWKERAIIAVCAAFPHPPEFESWSVCETILPHSLVCANYAEMDDTLQTGRAGLLASETGTYLYGRADYACAEPLYRHALAICEKTLGPEHKNTATILNNLALLVADSGDYAGAEPLYRRAVAIDEKALGPEHPNTATDLNNLATLLRARGNNVGAEPLLRRALAIFEKALGPEHPSTAACLNNLAALSQDQGDYVGAAVLLRRALAIDEKALGSDNPAAAIGLNNLAHVLHNQGDYAGAESLFRRALAIEEKSLGEEHPDTASSLNNLAGLLRAQGDYAGAEPLYRRALAIREKALGAEHSNTASSLNNLAVLLKAQGDYAGAEPLFRRALAIDEKALGEDHPDTVIDLENLATLLRATDRVDEAVTYEQRAAASRAAHAARNKRAVD